MMEKGRLYEDVLARMKRNTEHENMWMLSILIPSIPSRRDQLNRLRVEVQKQISYCRAVHPALGKVEVIIDNSKTFLQGGLSIGKKREGLVKRAKSKYMCFLDDDESIAPNYVETLLRLCFQDKDVCSFRNVTKLDNYWCIIDMSIVNPNEQAHGDYTVLRKPWHICPVRSEFAKRFQFPDSNYGEDWTWFEQVLSLCLTEAKTGAIIHQYNHSSKRSEADKISRS